MLNIVMELSSSNVEIVILKKDNRPVKTNTVYDFLNGSVNVPEEFQELLCKYLIDKKNRNMMKMLLNEQKKSQQKQKLEYITRMKREIIISNWSE